MINDIDEHANNTDNMHIVAAQKEKSKSLSRMNNKIGNGNQNNTNDMNNTSVFTVRCYLRCYLIIGNPESQAVSASSATGKLGVSLWCNQIAGNPESKAISAIGKLAVRPALLPGYWKFRNTRY